MSKKVLYIMNVDWNWIKQRPHYLAEGLSDKFDMKIVFQYRYGRKGFQKRELTLDGLTPIYVIPRIDRYRFGCKINVLIKKIYLKKIVKKFKPDIVYLTYPEQINWIPESYGGRIIYDCMDNYSQFNVNAAKKDDMIAEEKKMCEKASHILASSAYLKELLIKNYGVDKNLIDIVRNGYNGKPAEIKNTVNTDKKMFTMCYFGTFSDWFDFDFVLKSLNDAEDLEYLFIGPIDGIKIPKHDRIKYIGVVEHDELPKYTNEADCFVMPFVLNEVILSVDPVKLYEYINFNKNIICVKYPEISRFDRFVHFYDTYDEYIGTVKQLMSDNTLKYDAEERIQFLEKNSWAKRVEVIQDILERE